MGAHRGPGQQQVMAGPGHTDEAEPALLLQFQLVVGGAAVRQEVFLQTGDRHRVELQALGGVQRHQGHRAPFGVDHVRVADQRH